MEKNTINQLVLWKEGKLITFNQATVTSFGNYKTSEQSIPNQRSKPNIIDELIAHLKIKDFT